MVLLDFGGKDPHRVGLLYQSCVGAGGPARISGYGSFTMVIAQFGHFWESAVKAFVSPNSTDEDNAHNLDRIAELLDMPLRVEYLEEVLDTLAAVQ